MIFASATPSPNEAFFSIIRVNLILWDSPFNLGAIQQLCQIADLREGYFISRLFMLIPRNLPRFPLFSRKIFSRAPASRVGGRLVGGVVFACTLSCTPVHCLLLSTGVSAFQNSRARAGWISRFSRPQRPPLSVIVRHISICFPKGLELTAIILFTFPSYDPLMCLRCYLDPRVRRQRYVGETRRRSFRRR